LRNRANPLPENPAGKEGYKALVKLAPSIMCANYANLSEDIRKLEEAGADMFHFDIMDGHFVPNITMGADLVKALRPLTALPFDAHLMVREPDHLIPSFSDAGANILSVHVEACTHLHRTLSLIKSLGMKPAVALNPATPLVMIEHVLEHVEMVLIMTVNPGYAGQKLIESTLPKVKKLREIVDSKGLNVEIQVDGGINEGTIRALLSAGPDILVLGTGIFRPGEDVGENLRSFRRMVEWISRGEGRICR
jgi:ribulose-phosphate 3-epimerase